MTLDDLHRRELRDELAATQNRLKFTVETLIATRAALAERVRAFEEVRQAAEYVNECAGRGDIVSHVLGAGSPLRRLRTALANLAEISA